MSVYGCWSVRHDKNLPLVKIESRDEIHCRLICMETPGCYFVKYYPDCWIELSNTSSHKSFGYVHQLRPKCKGFVNVANEN